jgi:hypothetical protein
MGFKRRKRKELTPKQVLQAVSTAILELESIYLDAETDKSEKIRAINALSTLGNTFARISETADLEARILALESNETEFTQ